MKSIFLAAAAALVLGSAGTAQVTQYRTINPPLMKGDPEKMVCVAEEDLGSRLGKRKTCLTVEQWNEKAREHREFAGQVQSGTFGAKSEFEVETNLPGGPQ